MKLPDPRKPERIRVSMFGSFAQVKQISECEHSWVERFGYLLDNPRHTVTHECSRCGTFINKDDLTTGS